MARIAIRWSRLIQTRVKAKRDSSSPPDSSTQASITKQSDRASLTSSPRPATPSPSNGWSCWPNGMSYSAGPSVAQQPFLISGQRQPQPPRCEPLSLQIIPNTGRRAWARGCDSKRNFAPEITLPIRILLKNEGMQRRRTLESSFDGESAVRYSQGLSQDGKVD
jgi:hypothetical protein